MANKRPTEIDCEICGRPVTIPPLGRIANAHPRCGAVRNDLDRLQRTVDAAIDGMADADRARFRKMLVGELMSWTNGTFNRAKSSATQRQRGGASAGGATAAPSSAAIV